MLSRLQYISQGKNSAEQLRNISEALDAGCDWIQLRFKNADEKEFSLLAEEAKLLCRKYGAVFIVNDHVQIAKELEADGVHVGLTDMPVTEARKILDNKIIGGSANTFADVMQRVNEGADYVGLGPFRYTATKEKLSPILGIEGYLKIISQLSDDRIAVPVIAIGGIGENDVVELMRTGIHGVAISGALFSAANKKSTVEQFKNALYGTVEHSR